MRETGYYLIREEFTTVEIAYWDATKLKWLSLHGSFMHEGVPFKEIIKHRIVEMDGINPFQLKNNKKLLQGYEEIFREDYYNAKDSDYEFNF